MGGRSRAGRADAAGVSAALGASAVQQAGDAERRAALRAFLQRSPGPTELRVPASELRDGCARLGCEWCVDSLLGREEPTALASGRAPGRAGAARDLPVVRVAREAGADGAEALVIRRGAGGSKSDAAWTEQVVALAFDVLLEAPEGRAGAAAAPADPWRMLHRAARGAHAPAARTDALRAAVAERRAALERFALAL